MAAQLPDDAFARFSKALGGGKFEFVPANRPEPQAPEPTDEEEREARFKQLEIAEQFPANNPYPFPDKGKGKSPQIQAVPLTISPNYTTPTDVPNPLSFRLDERMGETTPPGKRFAVLDGVRKLPYKFLQNGKLQQPLASTFFDVAKFYTRKWELYYIWSPHCPAKKATLFVPEEQLQTLFDDFNRAFSQANARIDKYLADEGCVVQFDSQDAELRPKFLGYSSSREQLDYLSDNIKIPSYASEQANYPDFRARMEAAIAAGKNKKKGAKSRRAKEAGMNCGIAGVSVVKMESKGQLSKAQRILGLAAKIEDASAMPNISKLFVASMSADQPAPFPCELDAIIIAIDVEAWEKQHKKITEVGVATLDTRDLNNDPPGANGNGWHKHIRARHFRIAENKAYINHEHVHGCPDNFEFGKSDEVSMEDIPRTLASCFKEPFSAPEQLKDTTNTFITSKVPNGPYVNPPAALPARNLILLGHDIDQDIAYCRQLGFNVLARSNLAGILDTASIYRAYTNDPNPRALGSILYESGIEGWYLHNAGNDAVYTVMAMLATCVKAVCGTSGGEYGKKGKDKGNDKIMHESDEPLFLDSRSVGRDVFDEEGWQTLNARIEEDG